MLHFKPTPSLNPCLIYCYLICDFPIGDFIDGASIYLIQLMVYGRILYNNIKEYTPKWFPTIPYSQTVKPVFAKQPQVVSRWNAQPFVKRGWRLVGEVFKYSWAYQFFIFGLTFGLWATFYFPTLYVYQANNTHRTFEAAIAKERAHKKKLREAEAAAEAAEAAAEAQE